jgi:hypothetical protein
MLSLFMAAALAVSWLLERRRRATGDPAGSWTGESQSDQASDARVLARRLSRVLENARPVPLARHQVRIDKVEVYDLVAAVSQATAAEARPTISLQALVSAARAVEEAVRHAMPVPLTDEVRLPRERVDELVLGLRAAGA